MELLWALIGTTIYALAHEFFEWRGRIAFKQSTCSHRFDHETEFHGMKTLHCSKCGYQKHIPNEKDPTGS